MATNTKTKRINRIKRHVRIRARISGTAERPRISVFKSNKYTYAQAIDDSASTTVASANDAKLKKVPAPEGFSGAKEKRAYAVGQTLAEQLLKAGVSRAVFDKGGFKYHGRVKAVAEGLRNAGVAV